jgi:predicted nucleic-acid-binding Zn-ribbon protein
MKSGGCPKCGSNDVHSGEEVPVKAGLNNSNSIPIYGKYWTRSASLDNYVCVNCGYVESYISDPKILRKIAEEWPRADGRTKGKHDR